jgi:LmbE family N-acetylglucosaminyl deacetylase
MVEKTDAYRSPAIVLSLALLLTSVGPLPAQFTGQNDPANLAGERVSPPDLADTVPINHGAPALQQLLSKLRTRASFMLIVAHPDDEDGGTLTYLSRGQGARVAMLTLNRGEGGQNLMSADFDDALGLIRTQELLAADRYMGVDQFFGTEVDFGFSKTKEEAFAKWTHDRVLYDAVRAVRLYRPLVIASVFIGAPSDGHGQHQVSGQIAQEVFSAAGDPKVFPDQIASGLQPWQPLKVYARVPFARIDLEGMFDYATNQYAPARFINYVTGKVTTTVPKANVVVPEGTADPLLGGLSYVQFARQGLALQKSQIGQNVRLAPTGKFDVSYHRYGSRLNQPDGDDSSLETGFFEGIDTTLPGIATLAPGASPTMQGILKVGLRDIDNSVAEAQADFSPLHPDRAANRLREALIEADRLLGEVERSTLPIGEKTDLLHELRIKRVQLNNALVLAHGLTLEAIVKQPATPDPSAPSDVLTTQVTAAFHLTISESGQGTLTLKDANLSVPGSSTTLFTSKDGVLLKPNTELEHAVVLNGGLPATRPYFARPDIEQPYYDITDPALRNAPATPAPFKVTAHIDDQGVALELSSNVSARNNSSPSQPLVVVPPVSVNFLNKFGIIPLSEKEHLVWVEARVPISQCTRLSRDISPPRCQRDADEGKVHLNLLPGWQAEEDPAHEPVAHGSTLSQYDGFTLHPPPLTDGSKVAITAFVSWNGKDYAEGFRPVGYAGLVYTNQFTAPATYQATAVDLQIPAHLAVGYVKGTGDEVSQCLAPLLGGHVVDIPIPDLTAENLKRFDAVILGVRAYEAHPELAAANSALNAYAAAGGIVIAQYNTGRLPANTGPYPLSPGDSEKVVEEDAPVQILAPENPLFTWPNHITSADFDHWIEERGHGFMGTWDSHYTALLETHDAGQQPQRGGLLVAHTGRGAWIYLGLALYRQLPEGIPGPYRLLANLISAAKNPALNR